MQDKNIIKDMGEVQTEKTKIRLSEKIRYAEKSGRAASRSKSTTVFLYSAASRLDLEVLSSQSMDNQVADGLWKRMV